MVALIDCFCSVFFLLSYTQNGLLHMLDRNRRIKKCPEKFQETKEQFDIIVTVEERVYDQVLEHMESRDVTDNRPVHIFNVDIEDNHEEALMGAFLITDMITMVMINKCCCCSCCNTKSFAEKMSNLDTFFAMNLHSEKQELFCRGIVVWEHNDDIHICHKEDKLWRNIVYEKTTLMNIFVLCLYIGTAMYRLLWILWLGKHTL